MKPGREPETAAFATQHATEPAERGLLESCEKLLHLLSWARTRTDKIDQIVHLAHLDDGVFEVNTPARDLRHHMEGWDPHLLTRTHRAGYDISEKQPPHVPQPRARHPGMRDQLSWWRH